MAEAKRDQNYVTSMLFVGSDGLTYNAQGDELTGRLKVDLAGSSGRVTSVSVVSANGFAGTVATATTTPAITLTTTVSGILSGNGTAISAASTTGSGSVVLATSPSLTTPDINDATADSLQAGTTSGGVSIKNNNGVTVASFGAGSASSTNISFSGNVALAANSITLTGSIASTGSRVTKGWFTDIESTNIPTVGGVALLSSLTAPQFTTIELGNASDTTLSRVSAGVIAVEGVRVIASSGTTSGTILKNNGTTFVASTETYAAPGTSGNVMTSDGTNWTSAAPGGAGMWTYDSKVTFSAESGTKIFSSLTTRDFYMLVFNLQGISGASLTVSMTLNNITSSNVYTYFTLSNTTINQLSGSSYTLCSIGGSEGKQFIGEMVISGRHNGGNKSFSVDLAGGDVVSDTLAMFYGQLTSNSADLSSIEIISTNTVTGTVELWYKDNK